jgi:hypothetical protein
MLKPEDRPLFLSLLAIAVALFLNFSSSGMTESQPAQKSATAEKTDSNYASCSGTSVGFWPFCELGNVLYEHREVLNASSTMVIGLFTLALFFATYGQLRHLRREFNATHRPRIRVRFIQDLGVNVNDFWRGGLIISNVGETDATILTVAYDIARRGMTNKRWEPPGLDARVEPEGGVGRVVQPGQSKCYVITSRAPIDVLAITDIRQRRSELCALGEVQYRDDAGIVRSTGFLWLWNPVTEAFIPRNQLDDPEFIYEG